MSALAVRYMGLMALVPCVVCTRTGVHGRPAQVHHIAVGTDDTSDFAVAPLCLEHHDPNRTGSGFHGMGTEAFCRVFKVPGGSEYGLMVWAAEDLARLLMRRFPALVQLVKGARA